MGIELLEAEDLHALDEIQRNYPRDVGMCCTKMLQLWLERQPDASWEQLLQALKEVEMNDLASTIKQELLSADQGKLFVIVLDVSKATWCLALTCCTRCKTKVEQLTSCMPTHNIY